jgi:hypothetical protein
LKKLEGCLIKRKTNLHHQIHFLSRRGEDDLIIHEKQRNHQNRTPKNSNRNAGLNEAKRFVGNQFNFEGSRSAQRLSALF